MQTGVADLAVSAVDTLLALIKHRAGCRQCKVDESWCQTAGRYERLFKEEVSRYQHAKARL
jgi:hypothetical protein